MDGQKKLPPTRPDAQAEADAHAGTVVYVGADERYLGRLFVADEIRPESAATLEALKARGLFTAILSTGRPEAARAVARRLGAVAYRGERWPGDPAAVSGGGDERDRILFVGDGMGDASALSLARLGVAMGGLGAESAMAVADAAVLNESPAAVADLFTWGDRVRGVVRRHVVWMGVAKALAAAGAWMVGGGWWGVVLVDAAATGWGVWNASRVRIASARDGDPSHLPASGEDVTF